MKTYDLETLLDDFQALMKTNVAAQIDAINAEKDDGIVLDQIDDNAWYQQSLNDSNHNFDKFIWFRVDNVRTIVTGPAVARDITIEIAMFFYSANDNNIERKILRYWRAVQDATAQTWDVLGKGYDKGIVESLNPIDIQLLNSPHYHKVFGASLNFTLS